MQELMIFENEEFGKIRTLLIDGEPWFVGKDAAEILGYSNTRDSLSKHVEKEDKADVAIHDGRQNRVMVAINESGLYSLIFSSKLPTTKKFKRWVTTEVLPSIRKYGAYITMPKLGEIMANPESLELLLKQLLLETQKNKNLKNEIATLVPKGKYFDKLIASEMLTDFRTTAKELGLKPMAFTQFLIDKKYVYRDKHQRILPMQHYVHYGIFEIKDFCNNGYHGTQTLITVFGKLHFLEQLGQKEQI